MTSESTYSSDMKKILESALFSDLTLIIGDTEIKVHKFVLEKISPKFDSLIKAENSVVSTSLLICKDLQVITENPKIFRIMLEFIYTGQLDWMESNLKEVYNLAMKYEVFDLLAACESSTKTSVAENFLRKQRNKYLATSAFYDVTFVIGRFVYVLVNDYR